MSSEDRQAMRAKVSAMLQAGELQTMQTPVPHTSQEAALIEAELMGCTSLEGKLFIAGYSLTAHGERRCAECIYYQASARWCALPAINLPAEPDWWCRLWRI